MKHNNTEVLKYRKIITNKPSSNKFMGNTKHVKLLPRFRRGPIRDYIMPVTNITVQFPSF
jgi:hypothetical protein